jgi:hypothetical protein
VQTAEGELEVREARASPVRSYRARARKAVTSSSTAFLQHQPSSQPSDLGQPLGIHDLPTVPLPRKRLRGPPR